MRRYDDGRSAPIDLTKAQSLLDNSLIDVATLRRKGLSVDAHKAPINVALERLLFAMDQSDLLVSDDAIDAIKTFDERLAAA